MTRNWYFHINNFIKIYNNLHYFTLIELNMLYRWGDEFWQVKKLGIHVHSELNKLDFLLSIYISSRFSVVVFLSTQVGSRRTDLGS